MSNQTPASRSSDFANHSYDYRQNNTSHIPNNSILMDAKRKGRKESADLEKRASLTKPRRVKTYTKLYYHYFKVLGMALYQSNFLTSIIWKTWPQPQNLYIKHKFVEDVNENASNACVNIIVKGMISTSWSTTPCPKNITLLGTNKTEI